jgi:hypothetical protein
LRLKGGIYKVLTPLLLVVTMVSLSPSFLPVSGLATSDVYDYSFTVDEDGFTQIEVDFTSPRAEGTSWVFVPKFSDYVKVVSSGLIVHSETVETNQVVDEDYYFYQAFRFSFTSDGSFDMTIQFNITGGALIIEPRGMFFSTQIGFDGDSRGRAEVLLPNASNIGEAVALGTESQGPSEKGLNFVRFDSLDENLVRLQIEFTTGVTEPNWLTLKQGVFSFRTVERYEKYASDVLGLFDLVYNNLTNLFSVTLESVNVTFFIPDFETFLSVGGYIPFTGGKLGDIHVNIFFVRAVEGTIEIIALHELAHHFLLKAGLSPGDLLWLHEGMSQYVSIEVVAGLDYEGATFEKERLEDGAAQLVKDFQFLQRWSPESPPANIGVYYVASYYVIARIGEEYGGLDYYDQFFELIKGAQVENDNVLTYYFSLAANTTVAPILKELGFNIVDLYAYPELVRQAEDAISGINPLFQPYKIIAEQFYKQARISYEEGDMEEAHRYIELAILVARLAPILTLITVSIFIAAIVAVAVLVQRRRVPPESNAQMRIATPPRDDQTQSINANEYVADMDGTKLLGKRK